MADPPRRRAACKRLSSESSATWCAAELLPTVGVGAEFALVGGRRCGDHEHAVESPSANFWLDGAGVVRTTRLQPSDGGWGASSAAAVSPSEKQICGPRRDERPSAHYQVSASRPSTRCVVDETLVTKLDEIAYSPLLDLSEYTEYEMRSRFVRYGPEGQAAYSPLLGLSE